MNRKNINILKLIGVLFYSSVFLIKTCYSSQVLEFTIEPSDTVVPEGSSVLLQCAGKTNKLTDHIKDGKLSPNIRWRGPDGQDIGIVGDTFRTQLANGSLYISSVEENRGLTGAYQCLLGIDGIGTIVSRSAYLSIASLPEVNQESNEIYLYQGQTAFLKCISSLSMISPQGNYNYKVQWLKDDIPLRFDATRMIIMPSGSLEIDELTAQDRGTYQCNVTFENWSRLSSKSNLNIKSPSGLPESFAQPSFVAKPKTQTVKEGDRIILDCAANGNPKPTIKWLKNGEDIDLNDLDSRFQIIGTGSLQISSVEESDSGDYQCRASNTVDSLDESATLTVQVPPKFIYEPSDKVANEKDELELICSIYGKPTPTINWLKNGDVITPNDYMQIVAGHNLKILGLISSDSGMFQCVGNNPAGSVQAAARLEVLTTDKLFKRKHKNHKKQLLPSSTKRPKGGDIKQHFLKQQRVKESADPRQFSKLALDSLLSKNKKTRIESPLEWKSHDYRLDGQDDSDDDLEDYDDEEDDEDSIHPLGPDDDPKKLLHSLTKTNSQESGERAHFSNTPLLPVTRKSPSKYLDDNSEQERLLPGPPRDVQAQIVKPRFITLTWMEPVKNPDEVVSYSVFYKMNNNDRERKVTTKSRDIQEVNIQSLLPGKIYHFRVVANSNLGTGDSSEILEISTQPEENIAGSPQGLRGYAYSHQQIYLKWNPPLISNGDIVKYRVYYAEGDNGEEQFADTASTTQEMMLTDLRPYTEYAVSVVAWNQNGMGDPSSEILVKTFSATPSEPPTNVSVEVTSSTSILVRWEPPALEDRNGQITGYKIRYRKPKGQIQVETTPANVRHYLLNNLEKMSAYQIKIAAMTINGTGPATEWQHAETYENDLDESDVPGAPGWIRTRPTPTSIHVSWNSPVHQDIKVRGYILGWGKGVPDDETTELEENVRHHEIKNLEPNSEYVISLRARNLKGDGQPVYDTTRTREELPMETPTPLEVPVGLRAIPMSGTSIVVYWTDTTLSKSQHVTDNRYYVVRFSSTGSTRFRYHNTTDLNCMISDLRSNTKYEFAVKVVKGKRESLWSMSVLNTTMQAASTTPPRDLTIRIDEKNPYSVTLQWQPPKISVGAITNYVILYTTDAEKRDRDWSSELVPGDFTSATINQLSPNTNYYFKIQSKNAKGLGPFSAMVSHSTFAQPVGPQEAVVPGFLTKEMLYIIIGGSIAGGFVLILTLALIFCHRKTESTPEHSKKSYQKNNVGIIKPPDLWIHHDQMELKNMEKGHSTTTPGCSDGASSSGAMTLPRSVGHEYESETTILPPHVSNSLDKRTYVPGYMTNSMNSSASDRPSYPRTQYNIQRPPHIATMDPNLSQQNLQSAGSIIHSPENPYAYDVVPSGYSNQSVGYQPGMSMEAVKRGHAIGRENALKSFSIPAPPTSNPMLPGQKPVPSVTIKAQNSSPYKKSTVSTPLASSNRLQQGGPIINHSTDEVQCLKPSRSTEELNQEMANLEGLMKDLSAITASEFEC